MKLGVDGVHKQGPAVLQIGDHGHAEDADHQLHPTVRRRPRAQPFLDYCSYMLLPCANEPLPSRRWTRREPPSRISVLGCGQTDATAARIVATLQAARP